ncbi:hypothetical protein [Marinomonas algarum]|uniref:Soluble cytochrome b562 n=1 Tax=Marinomonas algarum TaxID=2883105 RepID=A0A9X1IR75_9GAMM|nr:hypothetical protein [Marinomonas algarum]MCB5162796.1 hypothetical protein [Marinomonas algarum]
MKKLTATTLAILATAAVSTSALADNDTAFEKLQTTKAGVSALSNTLENMGATVDTSVDLNGANTLKQKEAVYLDKYAELQDQFNTLNAQVSE